MPAVIPPAAAPVAPAPPAPPEPGCCVCANALLATNADATMTASNFFIFLSCMNLDKNQIRREIPYGREVHYPQNQESCKARTFGPAFSLELIIHGKLETCNSRICGDPVLVGTCRAKTTNLQAASASRTVPRLRTTTIEQRTSNIAILMLMGSIADIDSERAEAVLSDLITPAP